MTDQRTRWTAALLVGLSVTAAGTQLAGCGEALDDDELYIDYDLFVSAAGDSPVAPRAGLLDDINAAEDTIHAALYTLEDDAVASALLQAHQRGVDVRIVSDADNQSAAGFQTLADGELLARYGDGEINYLPDFFLAGVLGLCEERALEKRVVCTRGQGGEQGSMVRPGSFNKMSNNYVVIDQAITWNFTFPLDGRTEHPLAWRATGSEFSRDFAREAQQMYGGTFATTLNTYGSMLKSRQDYRVEYHTSDGPIAVRFNPQERLLKEVIDEVYGARASVYLATDNLMNPFLLDALEYKNQAGFDVQIVINGGEQATGETRQRLEALGARFVDRELPTLVLIDTEPDRDAEIWPRTALVLSHELIRGAPFDVERREPNDFVNIYPADQFYDGNMWMVTERGGELHRRASVDRLVAMWRTLD